MLKDLFSMPFLEADDGLLDGGAPNGEEPEEKTFTQEDVDRIIGERLNRESIHDYKAIFEALKDFGYEGTPAEVKVAIKNHAEAYKARLEEERLREKSDTTGIDPEILKEIEEIKKKQLEAEKREAEARKAEEERKAFDEIWNKQVAEFTEAYPDLDLQKLGNDPDFREFFSDVFPKLTLKQSYEKYVKLVGGAESKTIAKLQANASRSTTSGKSKGEAVGGTYGLTPRQQQLADENGMTYKEYADLLSHVINRK